MINKAIYFIVCFLLFLCIYLSAVKKTPFVEEGFTLQKKHTIVVKDTQVEIQK